MEKIKFYELSYSLDPAEIGTPVQIRNVQIVDFVDPEHNSEQRTNTYQYRGWGHVDPTLDLTKFQVDKEAKMTDLLSSIYFQTKGFFISEKARKILESFTLTNVKFFDSQVTHRSQTFDYSFLSFVKSPELVDFSKSTFIGDKREHLLRVGGPEIKVESYEEYKAKSFEIYHKKGFGFELVPIKLALKEKTDLFQPHFDVAKFASQDLKDRIEQEKLTGFTFKEIDIEFFLS